MTHTGLWLEEFYSHTENIQQKKDKEKQNKTKENYVQRTTIYSITILALNKSIQAVQLFY